MHLSLSFRAKRSALASTPATQRASCRGPRGLHPSNAKGELPGTPGRVPRSLVLFSLNEPTKRVPYPPRLSEGGLRGCVQLRVLNFDSYNAESCPEGCDGFMAAAIYTSSPRAAISASRSWEVPVPVMYFSKSSSKCARAMASR